MKKCLTLLLAVLLLAGAAGCARDMNWVISNEPSVEGVVEEVGGDYVILRVEQVKRLEGLSLVGQQLRLPRETRLSDCKFVSGVGERVTVWFAAEFLRLGDAPAEVSTVHGYTY